jgi:hypothetical protein
MFQSKKVAIAALVGTGLVGVVGGAFAAKAWVKAPEDVTTTISTGSEIVMSLSTATLTNGTKMYPGDTATIKVNADNQNIASKITATLSSTNIESTKLEKAFSIVYKVGETTLSNGALSASTSSQTVTIELTLSSTATKDLADKNITVTISMAQND